MPFLGKFDPQNSKLFVESSVFEWKYSFWTNLFQKLQINILSRFLILSSTGNTLFGQIWSRKSEFPFKLKFGT